MTRRDLLVQSAAIGLAAAAPAPAPDSKKARLRTAICAYTFRDALKSKAMSYDDLVRMAVDEGVDGLDLTVYWFPDTSDGFLLPLRRLAYKNGVDLYSISIRTNMCQPTPELRTKELGELRRWIDAAQKLGVGHIRVFGGTVPKTSTEDEAAGWVVEVLKQGAEYAGQRGIILGLENHGGITSKAERILEIVKKVDSPWVGINVDTGNFERDAVRQLDMCLPQAVNVQMKVEMRDAEGKKQRQDWDQMIGMIAKHGYRGYLALEYEEQNPEREVPKLLSQLNTLARKYSA